MLYSPRVMDTRMDTRYVATPVDDSNDVELPDSVSGGHLSRPRPIYPLVLRPKPDSSYLTGAYSTIRPTDLQRGGNHVDATFG